MCRSVAAVGILIYAISWSGCIRRIESQLPDSKCGVDGYRCENGQCINSTSVCDGEVHCEDGRDESFEACRSSIPLLPASGYPRQVRVRRASKILSFSTCVLPPQPKNGTWKLHPYYCDSENDCDVAEGSFLDAGTQLIYTCDRGARLRGNRDVICGGRGKWSSIPVCDEIRCPGLNSVSTSAVCSRRGVQVNCDYSVLPETKAKISCQAGYRKNIGSTITRRDKVECRIDGRWYPNPIKCDPECGVANIHQKPYVLNGTRAMITDFPWHATLYRQTETKNGPIKEFKCGATVIHAKLVLSAAHCVYEEGTKSTTRAEILHVATGNVFRDYDSPAHDSTIVQKRAVRNVYRYCQYYGLSGNYVADIAVLEMHEPFKFSGILLPACLDVSDFSNQILEVGASGRVAGFGKTQSGTTSGILQTITVPYVSYADCKISRQGATDEVYISDDKFCAGFSNGTAAVCEGDSGGGLVFPKNNLWYVMGVVSVALGDDTRIGEQTCAAFSYTLYTKVGTYIEWIQDIILGVELDEYVPLCDVKCTPVNSPSTVTVCLFPRRRAICDFPVPPQTRARISCRAGYVKDTTGGDNVECTLNGKWSPEPVKCVPSTSEPSVVSTVPSVITTPTTPSPSTSPSVPESTSAEIPCSLQPNPHSAPAPGICTDASRCPSFIKQLSEYIYFPQRTCTSKDPLKNFCCPLSYLTPEISTTTKPVTPTPTAVESEHTTVLPGNKTAAGDGRGEIARMKCNEYAKYVTERTSRCDTSTSQAPITMSITAEPAEFPYMALIGFKKDSDEIRWRCTGTLISDYYVIGVAHCSQNPEWGKPLVIRIGDISLDNDGNATRPQERLISEIIRHPSYKRTTVYHDLALYKMKTPVDLDVWVLPACLYTSPVVGSTTNYIVTSWGPSDWTSPLLQKLTVNVIDQDTCAASYGKTRILPEGIVADYVICADESLPETCKLITSGNPMVTRSTETPCMKELVGISSFSKLCSSSSAGGYMRIYNYIRWIESIVWPEV